MMFPLIIDTELAVITVSWIPPDLQPGLYYSLENIQHKQDLYLDGAKNPQTSRAVKSVVFQSPSGLSVAKLRLLGIRCGVLYHDRVCRVPSVL